jgi:hypothetical protein
VAVVDKHFAKDRLGFSCHHTAMMITMASSFSLTSIILSTQVTWQICSHYNENMIVKNHLIGDSLCHHTIDAIANELFIIDQAAAIVCDCPLHLSDHHSIMSHCYEPTRHQGKILQTSS